MADEKEKKSQFAIYKIHFFIDRERNLYNQDINVEENLKHADRCMFSLFDMNKVEALYKSHQNGEALIFPNDVMCERRWNVIWWRVNNVQVKNYVKRLEGLDQEGRGKYEPDHIESYPSSNVILDLRPDYLQIAIEKTPAWSNTDRLKDILQESFHRLLSDKFGLDLEIEPKMEPTKFWEFIHKQIFENNDFITKVSFTFANQRKMKGVNLKGLKNARLKALAQIAANMDALKSHFIFELDRQSNKKITEKNRDMAEMVNLCCNADYDLTVHFKKFKLYRKDELVKAYFSLPQSYLTSFSHNSVNLNGTLDLVDWLDDVRDKILKYDDEAKTTTR